MNKTIRFIASILFIITMLSISYSKVFAYNTDYVDKKQKKEKGIGVAVIDNKGIDVDSYFYLYYDDKGEVHVVQYLQNPMLSEKEKKWILKTDADNSKAKELGAKEYYKTEDELKKDENKNATELYKKIVKKLGSNKTLYDYIEGTDDIEPYTIEKIIFNEVPIFDINVFSDTAGGKEVKEDSPIGIIRKLVAVWFVSFRNVTLVSLVILIIYYGIRIAISAVASEKAHYKEMLLGWLKSLILTLMINVIIYVIIYFNELFVTTFKKINEDEGSIYATIKTRALEVPWKIGVPATILYLTLLLMWLRFIWAYFKRLFTVMMLIILAPLVLIRYAIESASGKGSHMVSNWLQRFFTSVFIQSIHALLYVAFVENALKIALDDLHGFFIALFFLNFILSADALFANIFKFEFNPGDIREMLKPFKPRQQLSGVYLTYNATKRFIGAVDEVSLQAGRFAKNEIYKGYLKATDAIDDATGGSIRESIEESITDHLDDIDDLFITPDIDADGNPIEVGMIRGKINETFKIRKIARRKDMEGVNARHLLKLKRSTRKRTFKSGFKIIKDIGFGISEGVFLVPIMVQEPKAGLAIFSDSVSRIVGSRRAAVKFVEKTKDTNEHLDDVVHSIISADHDRDFIEQQLDTLTVEERQQAINQIKQVNTYNINQYYLTYKIHEYMVRKNIREIDDSTVEDIISSIVDGIPGDITQEERQAIKEKAIVTLQQITIEEEDDQKRRERQAQEDDREETRRRPEERTQQDNGDIDTTIGVDSDVEVEDAESTADEDEATREERRRRRRNENDDEDEDDEEDSNRRRRRKRKGKITYSFGDIAEAIEDAVIETKVDNKFAKIVKALDNIKDTNTKEENKEDSEGKVVDVNKFIDSL
ncbi:MAG: hypothetical protein IKG56_04385 [Clostridia bacterium]|nr:hypothetical protein [Clostridia bacterium]